MKRWALNIVVFLLLGAIVNVAVAWGAMTLPQPTGGAFYMLAPGPAELQWWQAHAPEGFAAAPTEYFDHVYLGRCLTDMLYEERGDPHLGPLTQQTVLRRRAGWPMLAFEGATWSEFQVRLLKRQTLFDAPFSLDRGLGLPYAPMPMGFAINTMFYALMLWLLYAAPFALRRRMRIKRGLCPACAYPVGESDTCTECGQPVKTHKRMNA